MRYKTLTLSATLEQTTYNIHPEEVTVYVSRSTKNAEIIWDTLKKLSWMANFTNH